MKTPGAIPQAQVGQPGQPTSFMGMVKRPGVGQPMNQPFLGMTQPQPQRGYQPMSPFSADYERGRMQQPTVQPMPQQSAGGVGAIAMGPGGMGTNPLPTNPVQPGFTNPGFVPTPNDQPTFMNMVRRPEGSNR